jgi:folate-binding protein YgfZ
MPIATLAHRAVLELSGEDRLPFLQGLVSNDMTRAGLVWSALLTPQGKWLADFFTLQDGERLLLDVESGQAAAIMGKLMRFRLRSKVAMRALEGWVVQAGWDEAVPPQGKADPRLAEAGWRILTDRPLPTDAGPEAYDAHRLALGLPDGSRDMESEHSVLLEAGFDELNGVSWTKGCYMGQELTARTRYRGLVKRRLVPVEVEGPLPSRGTPVTRNGVELGEMRSGRQARGMALLRLAALDGAPLACGEAVLRARVPAWMRLPETA